MSEANRAICALRHSQVAARCGRVVARSEGAGRATLAGGVPLGGVESLEVIARCGRRAVDT